MIANQDNLPDFGSMSGFLIATCNGSRVLFRISAIAAIEDAGKPGDGSEVHLTGNERIYPVDQCAESLLLAIAAAEPFHDPSREH